MMNERIEGAAQSAPCCVPVKVAVKIPASIEDAVLDLKGLAELVTASEWKRAAIGSTEPTHGGTAEIAREATYMTEGPTYADNWRNSINKAGYGMDYWDCQVVDQAMAINALRKAAECLRQGATHTFTGDELDVVRHIMPAHECHQSGAIRFVNEFADAACVDRPVFKSVFDAGTLVNEMIGIADAANELGISDSVSACVLPKRRKYQSEYGTAAYYNEVGDVIGVEIREEYRAQYNNGIACMPIAKAEKLRSENPEKFWELINDDE